MTDNFLRKAGHPSEEALAAFLDGVLRGGEREEILKHLAECDECRAFVVDWSRVAMTSTGGSESLQ